MPRQSGPAKLNPVASLLRAASVAPAHSPNPVEVIRFRWLAIAQSAPVARIDLRPHDADLRPVRREGVTMQSTAIGCYAG